MLIDDADPPWSRRGMSYADAWYVGGATLDQVDACFCASVKSIPAVLARGDMIAATTWSWPGVATALQPTALILVRRGTGTGTGTALASTSAATSSPVFGELLTVHVHARAAGLPEISVAARRGREIIDAGDAGWNARRETFATVAPELRVDAPHAGRFRTRHEIAERVEAGDVLGTLDGYLVVAPASGVLRALSARGARVAAGHTLVEIDRSGDPQCCFGVKAPARAIADRVGAALRNAARSRTEECLAAT